MLRGAPVAAAIAAFPILSAALFPFTIDDAYITLRYARNFADGAGAVFDVQGRQPEAYSSPLWMLTAAGAFRMGLGDDGVVVFVKLLGMAFGAATVLATAAWTRAWTGSAAAAARAAVMLSLMPWLAFWSVSGLETSLYAFLVVAALLALEVEKTGLRAGIVTGGVLALLALARPEGIALAAGMLFGDATARRRMRTGAAAVAVLTVAYGTYCAWRLWYFGSLVPATAAAKSGSFGAAHLSSRAIELAPFAVYLAPLLLLYAVGRRAGSRMPSAATGAAIAAAAFAVVPRLEGAPGFRYELALLPLAAGAAATGWWRHDAVAPPWRRGLVSIVVVGVLLAPLITLWPPARFSPAPPEIAFARWLRAHAPGSSVGVYDLGAVPYYSAAPRVIDTNPAALLPPFPGRAYDVGALLGEAPSFLVLPPEEERVPSDPLAAVYDRAAFRRDYQPLFELTSASGYRVVVWKHRAVALNGRALDAAAAAGLSAPRPAAR